MSEVSHKLHMTGPDFYCPDCGRVLVSVHENGTFDLAGKSSCSTHLKVDFDRPELTEDGDLVAYITEATCLYRRCRLRRWLRKEGAV